MMKGLMKWWRRGLSAKKQIQVNEMIMRLNQAAVRLRAAARSDFQDERSMLAFRGEEDLRAVKRQLAAMGMDYQG